MKIKIKQHKPLRVLLPSRNLNDLYGLCQRKNIMLLDIRLYHPVRDFFQTPRLKAFDRLMTYEHLATALEGGFSLSQGLGFCGATPSLQMILWAIEDALSQGESIENILENYKDLFIKPAPGVLGAGFAAGQLSQSFKRLGAFHHQELAFQDKIKKSLQYPLFVLVLILSVLGLLMTYLLPVLDSFLTSTTQNSGSLQVLYLIPGIFLSLFLGGVGLWLGSRGQHKIALKINHLIRKIPLLGSLMVSKAWWVHMHVYGLLIENHYHPLNALGYLKKHAQEPYVQQDLERVFHSLNQGNSFEVAMMALETLPLAARNLLCLGLKTGNLTAPLQAVCQLLNSQVERYSHRLVIFAEPMSLLIMGGFMLMLVMTIFAPLYSQLTEFGVL